MTKAAKNIVNPVIVNPTFSDIPSWTRFKSVVIQLIISPVPKVSKKAIFWRMSISASASSDGRLGD
jgi:hypothetical protein